MEYLVLKRAGILYERNLDGITDEAKAVQLAGLVAGRRIEHQDADNRGEKVSNIPTWILHC